jgi:chemotaxis response regulator CheB
MKEIIEQLMTEIKARLEVENAKEYDEAKAVDDLITISFLNGGRVALQSVLQAMEERVVK